MPEPAEQSATHGRSLTGFYIGLGVVAVLVGLGAWLWIPAKMWYWEREVRENSTPSSELPAADAFLALDRGRLAADRLVAIGPRASPAVARMIAHSPNSLKSIAQALGKHKARWAIPMLAEACRKETRTSCINAIVAAAEEITGESLQASVWTGSKEEASAKAFLKWWEREGESKYGGSVK